LLAVNRGKTEFPLCPACVFDGDVFDSDDDSTAMLTYQFQRLVSEDLAMPAGWAGPIALLACTAPDGFAEQLEQWWDEFTFFGPLD